MYAMNFQILDAVASLREGRGEEGVLKLWPNYVTGEDLFGLTEPAVVRVLESLPGEFILDVIQSAAVCT